MLGKSKINLLNSITTGTISAATQPLFSPAHFPGEGPARREETAPLNNMSYFSNGSMVRFVDCAGCAEVLLRTEPGVLGRPQVFPRDVEVRVGRIPGDIRACAP